MDDNDPRFAPITRKTSDPPSGPVKWRIRRIAKDTESGRSFFYDHYRPFRLKMHAEAPYAYWTRLEREALLPREEWDRRLQRPTASTYVALVEGDQGGKENAATTTMVDIESRIKIISSLILRGPLPTSDLTSPVWKQLGHAGCAEYWEINAVFTDEEYRRMGVASAMIDEAVRVVSSEGEGQKCFLRVIVLIGNEEAIGLYEKAGFTDKWENSGGWELVRWIGFDPP